MTDANGDEWTETTEGKVVKPSKLLGQVDRTERGFEIVEFKDANNTKCTLQQSSLAECEPPGCSAIWLGLEYQRMHLRLEQVKMLIESLQLWVDNGSFNMP